MSFLYELKKKKVDISLYKIIGFPFLAAFLTLLKGLIKEHGYMKVAACSGRAGRLLKALFYTKLIRANSAFHLMADDSIITKTELFEMSSMIAYVRSYPRIYNFPIIAIISLIIMTYFISYFTLIAVAIFIILSILLFWIVKKL